MLPGHVTEDKLRWLRAEFFEVRADPERLRIAWELLRRAEAVGDRVEAVRWRAEVDKHQIGSAKAGGEAVGSAVRPADGTRPRWSRVAVIELLP